MVNEMHLRVRPNMPLKVKIRLARMAAGLPPETLARRVGISRLTYERMERGERVPRRGELIAIAHETGQDLGFFDLVEAA